MNSRVVFSFIIVLSLAWLFGCQQSNLSSQSNLDTTYVSHPGDQPVESAVLNDEGFVNADDLPAEKHDFPKWTTVSSRRVALIGIFRPGAGKAGIWLDRPSGRIELEFEKDDWTAFEQLQNQRVVVEGDLEERHWPGNGIGAQQGMIGVPDNFTLLRVSAMSREKETNDSFISRASR